MIHEYIWGTEDWIYEDKDILIKRIDARNKLSVQVHPDDAYAKAHGLDNGKTECWYIVDCREGAFLYCGVDKSSGIDKELFAKAVADGTIERYLNKIYVRPGDFIFIPAGAVHAIGAGIKLIEVQQDSKTTYRLYDYKRVDEDSNERELHVEQGLECTDLDSPCGLYELPFSCEYFSVDVKSEYLNIGFSDNMLSVPLR